MTGIDKTKAPDVKTAQQDAAKGTPAAPVREIDTRAWEVRVQAEALSNGAVGKLLRKL